MQWLDFIVSLEAGGGFVLASLNCLYLIDFARQARTAARKAGASSLAIVCGGLALEALLFLSQTPVRPGSAARWAAVVVVRSALLVSPALISALIWRSLWLRRR